jgi:hypothetical protein
MKPGNVYRQLVALLPLFSQEVLLSICILLEDLLSLHILPPTFVFLKIFIKSFSSITLSSLNYLETLHKKIGELLYQSTRV